jgi:orotidine-5'-phosphate decarboxylase
VNTAVRLQLEGRRLSTLDRIKEVDERVAALEVKVATDKAEVLQRIVATGEELQALLADFKVCAIKE